jgi:hypothetical protein
MTRSIQTQRVQTLYAAPPDDGGTQGTYTRPEDTVMASPSDTRSSQTLENTELRPHDTNKGLWHFWLMVAVGAGLIVLVGLLQHGR